MPGPAQADFHFVQNLGWGGQGYEGRVRNKRGPYTYEPLTCRGPDGSAPE
jgi:hypothetical protein